MKKISRGEIAFYVIIVLSLIMVNPPILGMINRYAMANPLTFRLPTIWVWLQFWYTLMIVSFLVAAIRIKRWNCFQDEKPIEPEERSR